MKKFFKIFSTSLIVSIFSFSLTASAFVIESGNIVDIREVVEEDLYISSVKGEINSDVLGDLYIAAGFVEIEANIAEDLVVLGGQVEVDADVRGDVRIFGGDVKISGTIEEDLVISGGNVTISEDSQILGSVLLSGAYFVTIEGDVAGDLVGAVSIFDLSGNIAGDVSISVQEELDLLPGSQIGGNLTYYSIRELEIPEDIVAGEISHEQLLNKTVGVKNLESSKKEFFIIRGIWGLTTSSLLALLLVIFTPNLLLNVGRIAQKETLNSFGIGLMTLIVGFVAVVILAMTVLGISISLLLLNLLLIAVYFTKIFLAAWLSLYILKEPAKKSKKKAAFRLKYFASIFLMLLLYYGLLLIPYFGALIRFIGFTIVLGAIVKYKKEICEHLLKKKLI